MQNISLSVMHAKKITLVAYPTPVDYAHPIWYILDSVEVGFPFIHPSSGWDDSSVAVVSTILQVGIINVGVGCLVSRGSLVNVHTLGTWVSLQHIELLEKLRVGIS